MNITRAWKYLRTTKMILEITETTEMNYHMFPDYRYMAHPVINLFFPREKEGPAENPIEIDEVERFSEPRTTVREQQLLGSFPIVNCLAVVYCFVIFSKKSFKIQV